MRVLPYFFCLDHGQVADRHGGHEAHGKGCHAVKGQGAHDKDDRNGRQDHAKGNVSPDANVFHGLREIGTGDEDAEQCHGEKYGGISNVFDGICDQGRERDFIPKYNEA